MASEHYTVRIQEGADPEAVARRLFDSVPGFQGFYPMMNQSIGDSILKRYYVAEFWTDDVEATRRKIFQVSGVEIAYPKPDGGAPADHEASLVRGAKKLMAFKLIGRPGWIERERHRRDADGRSRRIRRGPGPGERRCDGIHRSPEALVSVPGTRYT
jgi:hypothetical protein